MNKSMKTMLEAVCAQTGLRLDEATSTVNGVSNGYHFTVAYANNRYQIYASIRKNGQLPEKEFFKEGKKSIQGASSVGIEKNNVVIGVSGMTTKKMQENLVSAILSAPGFFRQWGYEDVCECCGKPVDKINIYKVATGINFLCEDCYNEVTNSLQQAEIHEENTNENVVGGIVGALLGALIGTIAIVIIGQMGYVAAVSGLIMGVCTIKGYEKFARKISGKGIVVCSIVMILMTYLGVKSDWAITIAKTIDFSFFDAFNYFWEIVNESGVSSEFIGSLLLCYLFTAGGAVPCLLNAIKAQKEAYTSYQIQ